MGYLIGSIAGWLVGMAISLIIIRELEKRSERKWQDWMKENGVIEI